VGPGRRGLGQTGRFVLDAARLAAVRELRDGGGAERSRALLEELRPRLLRYFSTAPFSRADAEDLVQTTLALVVQHAGTLQDEERFVGWLYAIAGNVKSTARERLARERRVATDAGNGSAAVDAGRPADRLLEDAERRAALHAALATLPARQRQCLTLRVRDELSYAEIAALLRLDPLTVRNHIAQAKKRLRGLVAEEGRRW